MLSDEVISTLCVFRYQSQEFRGFAKAQNLPKEYFSFIPSTLEYQQQEGFFHHVLDNLCN